ncbi:MAG: CDP-archaeol synthase [Thermogladius sp.]
MTRVLYSTDSALVALVEFVLMYYLSPMVANSAPVLVRGRTLIDGGRLFPDGRPVFGSHKTWEGFLAGVVMGFTSSCTVGLVFESLPLTFLNMGGVVAALLGDLGGAFVKRRLGIEPGEPLPVVDQLDFALAATLLYLLLDAGFASRLDLVVMSLLIILVLHLLTNNVAFVLGLKNKRW